jgi:hypothetical protein
MFSFEMTFNNIIFSLIIVIVICTLLFLCIEYVYQNQYLTKLIAFLFLCIFANNFQGNCSFIRSIILAFATLYSINIAILKYKSINIDNLLLFPMNTITYFSMIMIFAAIGIYANSILLCEMFVVFLIILFGNICGYLCGYVTIYTNFNNYTHKYAITIVYAVEIVPSITISSTFVACIGKIIENDDLSNVMKLFIPSMINISVFVFYVTSLVLLVCIYKKSILFIKDFIVLYFVEWIWLLVLTKINTVIGTFLCMVFIMMYFSFVFSDLYTFILKYFQDTSKEHKKLKIILLSFSSIFLLLIVYVMNEYFIEKYCLQTYFHLIPAIE